MARFPIRSDGRRPWRYRLVAGGFRVVFRTYFVRRIHLDGFEGIPREGALLVASNHLSNLDPLLLGAFFPSTLFAMAKKELFRRRWLAWVLRGCNTFPVDRGGADRGALRTAFSILEDGGRLLIFVEGTRARTPGMKRAETGAGFLQRRSGADVLPVAIWGSDQALGKGGKWLRRADIHLRAGEVIRPAAVSGRANDQAISDEISRAIAAMLPAEYRGAYATSEASAEPE